MKSFANTGPEINTIVYTLCFAWHFSLFNCSSFEHPYFSFQSIATNNLLFLYPDQILEWLHVRFQSVSLGPTKE